MGGGTYCFSSRATRTKDVYSTASAGEIFTEKSVNSAMNPNGITIREARDSKEHPNSFPIILALDVTGSMGSIPLYLVKEGLPNIMEKIIKGGIADPQVLFLGIGDHECDKAPLQVGQFESSDDLLDKWLTTLWIESGGGGNEGESYLLAWFFANRYTSTDHFEKRKGKGVLITIGDEPVLKQLPRENQRKIMGNGEYSDATASEFLDKVKEKYEVYHLHMLQGQNGEKQEVKDGWKQIMGSNVIYVQKREDVSQTIADIVLKHGLDVKKEVKEDKKEEIEVLT